MRVSPGVGSDSGSARAANMLGIRGRMGSGGGVAVGVCWHVDTLTLVLSCVLPVGLRIDEQALPTLSTPVAGNGVLEPNETVVVDPVYQAVGSGASLLGTAEALSGPGDPQFLMAGAPADCGEYVRGSGGDGYTSACI